MYAKQNLICQMKLLNRKKYKKWLIITLLLSIVCIPLHVVHNKIGYFRNLMMSKQMGGLPILKEVPVIQIKKHNIEKTYTFPAKTVASKVAEIRPQITGILTKIMFTEGSFVQKGTKLYQIDPAERITIFSPISGYISRSFATEGALVTQNQSEPLATVTQLDPIYIDIPIPSSYLAMIKNKKPTVSLLVNGKKYQHKGTIQFTEVFVNKSTDSFIVRSQFSNPNGELLAGMYVDAQIVINEGLGVEIPQRTVSMLPDSSMAVMVVEKDGTIAQKIISVDGESDNNWVVKNGLSDGDLLIYEGFQKIQHGMKVQHKVIQI